MSDINFYHLTQSSVENVLRVLLTKSLSQDKRVLLYGQDTNYLKRLDAELWENPADSFLPHGLDIDDSPETQPILLTNKEDNLNEASFLITLEGCSTDFALTFERCFDIFDGRDEAQVAQARKRWKNYVEKGEKPSYWKQNADGKWEKAK